MSSFGRKPSLAGNGPDDGGGGAVCFVLQTMQMRVFGLVSETWILLRCFPMSFLVKELAISLLGSAHPDWEHEYTPEYLEFPLEELLAAKAAKAAIWEARTGLRAWVWVPGRMGVRLAGPVHGGCVFSSFGLFQIFVFTSFF